MFLRAIDRVMKSLYRSVFPDPRLRPRQRSYGFPASVAADVRCLARAVEALEPRMLLSGIALQSLNDATAFSEKSHGNLGVFAAGVPAVLVVDSAVDRNDGDYRAGRLSLREAVFLANADSDATTIKFAKRLTKLRLSQVGDNTADNSALAITSAVTIIGPAGTRGVTLVGTGSSDDLRLFRVLAGGDLTLRGLTMRNWSTDTNGGVLVVDPAGIATLTDCTLSNNTAASQGGAIFNSDGRVTLTNCTLSGNRAHDGGAYNGGGQTYGGDATFTNCILRGNTAVDRGGAIALYNSGVRMTNCTLVGNSAHQGGGIAGGQIILDHTTFIGNRAVDGGGIFTGVGGGANDGPIVQVGGPGGNSYVELDSCTFTGNSAQHRGGGLYLVRVFGRIENCTLSANHALQGGGIFADTSGGDFFKKSSERIEISRTVFSANSAVSTGGGIFNANGAMTVRGGTFHKNVAQQGAALYNDLGWAEVTDSTVVRNLSRRGISVVQSPGDSAVDQFDGQRHGPDDIPVDQSSRGDAVRGADYWSTAVRRDASGGDRHRHGAGWDSVRAHLQGAVAATVAGQRLVHPG